MHTYTITLPHTRPPITAGDTRRWRGERTTTTLDTLATQLAGALRQHLPHHLLIHQATATITWHTPNHRTPQPDTLQPLAQQLHHALGPHDDDHPHGLGILPDHHADRLTTELHYHPDPQHPRITITLQPEG